jgi:hypothetical protein
MVLPGARPRGPSLFILLGTSMEGSDDRKAKPPTSRRRAATSTRRRPLGRLHSRRNPYPANNPHLRTASRPSRPRNSRPGRYSLGHTGILRRARAGRAIPPPRPQSAAGSSACEGGEPIDVRRPLLIEGNEPWTRACARPRPFSGGARTGPSSRVRPSTTGSAGTTTEQWDQVAACGYRVGAAGVDHQPDPACSGEAYHWSGVLPGDQRPASAADCHSRTSRGAPASVRR